MSDLGRKAKGFTLLELVIVVVIIGIIAAIAIPRLSRGSAGAADNSLSGNLAVLRSAIDLYSTEHGGAFPTAAGVSDQLQTYTDANGTTNASRTTQFIYGPYVRKVPPLPVGAKRGSTGIASADAAGIGWIYNATTGSISANCTVSEVDSAGTKYSDY
jgi:prepilin-type N-terminal cleavage/methylation domain-containing protein